MEGWTCPHCDRRFRRTRQPHECAPAMTLEEYFANGPPHERPVVEAVVEYLRTLGPIHLEPVAVGVFVKTSGTFVELRPMTKWVALWFPMPRPVAHRTITRRPVESGARTYHVANLHSPDDLDDDLRAILAESYAFAG